MLSAPFRAIAQDAAALEREDESLGLSLSVSGSLAGETTQRSSLGQSGEVSTEFVTVGIDQTIGERLTVGLNYETTRIDMGRNPTLPLPERLRGVSASMMYRHPINERWTGMVFLNPGWFTAGGADWFSNDGFGVTTGIGVRRQYSPTFAYSLGVAYNSLARSSLRVLPVVGIEWQPAEDWTVAVGFPRTEVVYAVTKQFRVGLAAEGIGGTYFVEDDPRPAIKGRPALADTKLEFYEIRSGLKATYAFNRTTSISASAGWVFKRNFDYDSAGYELESHGTAPYVSVSASIGF